MAWLIPKTSWKSTDHFNKEDYNRIADNLRYIKGFAKKFITRVIHFKQMWQKTSYTQFLEPDEVNTFQTNLHAVNNKIGNYDLGEDTEYFRYGATPTHEQWNRIEGYTLQIYDNMLERTTSTRLTQKLGNADSRRGIRI